MISYSAAISACEKGWQWRARARAARGHARARHRAERDQLQRGDLGVREGRRSGERALELLEGMRERGIEPDVISYSAAISACEKGGQWERALELLEGMRERGIEPDVISYSAAISACARASQAAHAEKLFKELWDSPTLQADQVTFNAILDAVSANVPRALALWKLGLTSGHYLRIKASTDKGMPKLDLHDLSEGAAVTAVRWWLEEHMPSAAAAPRELTIITGWGKSRPSHRDSDVRGRVEAVLLEMGVSLLPTANPGRIVVDATSWRERAGLASRRESL